MFGSSGLWLLNRCETRLYVCGTTPPASTTGFYEPYDDILLPLLSMCPQKDPPEEVLSVISAPDSVKLVFTEA